MVSGHLTITPIWVCRTFHSKTMAINMEFHILWPPVFWDDFPQYFLSVSVRICTHSAKRGWPGTWKGRTGLLWVFQFISKVFSRIEVRALFRTLEFLKTKLIKPYLYGAGFVPRDTVMLEKKWIWPQNWKHTFVKNVFICCSINCTLHWKHLNYMWRVVHICRPYSIR